jgi:broad specificity phosphatase PhoE
MDLIIVRHGQSTGNISTDDIPDGPLTPLGERQALETAVRLANSRITHVLSSPLVRALATGSAIARAAGLAQVEVWPELQEHRRDVHRGFGRAELLRDFPLAIFPHSVEADGWDHGGETYESAIERGQAAVIRLRERFNPGDKVVIATHGAFANYLLRAILHIPAAQRIWFTMNNCGISRVRFAKPPVQPAALLDEIEEPVDVPADAEVICVNDISHLSEIS